MRTLLGVLIASLSLGMVLGVGSTALGQTFSVDLSASLPFDLSGPALEEASLTATVSTELEGVSVSATGVLTLAGLSSAVVSASTTVEGVSISSRTTFTSEGFSSENLTVSRAFDPFQLSAAVTLKPGGFESATFSARTQTAEGVSLSGSTKITREGFAQKVLSVGLSMSGLQLSRTTVLTPQGLARESWTMTAQVQGYQISRTTVFTAEGFASETISLATTVEDIDLSGSTTFDTTGFAGAELNLSGALTDEVSFDSTTSLDASWAWKKKVSVSGSLDRFDLTGTFWITPEGFERGRLDVSTSFQDLSLGGTEETEEEAEE